MAGILSRIFAPTIVRASSGVPASQYIPVLGSIQSAAGMSISQGTAMSVSAVYGCVTIRSEDVARCTPSLYRPQKDGNDVLVTDHPVAKLFKKPNRVQTWFEFCEQMQVALMLRCNAYAAIIRDRKGNPIELIPINPDAVSVLEAVDGSIFYSTNRLGLFQMAALSSFPVSIPAEDIFHLRGLTFNMLVSPARIALGADAIGVTMGLEQQAARWMSNGARPSGILKSPKTLTESAATRLKQQWNNIVQGAPNTGATAVLEEGLEWQPLSLDAATLEFLSQRNFQIEDIARFYRMPPHKLGRMERTASAGLAQQNQDYVSNTIAPDLERWEQKIALTFDLDAEGLIVDFDEAKLLRADVATRYNVHRIAVTSGIKTINEVRADEGLPPVEGGDKVLVPSNTAALGSDMNGQAPDAAGRPANGMEPKPKVPTGGDQPGAEDVAKVVNLRADRPWQAWSAKFNDAHDERGRFTTGSGGAPSGSGSTGPALGMELHAALDAARAEASKQGFDPKMVTVTDKEYPFTVDGHAYKAAGSANLKTGMITIYTNQITPQTMGSVMAHEIEHQRFESVMQTYGAERNALLDDPKFDDYLRASGEVRSPEIESEFGAKYPTYYALNEDINPQFKVSEMAKDDGVTDYSRAYWNAWHNSDMQTDRAYHETLAEMNRQAHDMGYSTGSPRWEDYSLRVRQAYVHARASKMGIAAE